MTELVELLTAPWQHEFMQRALVVAVASGVVCGVVGTHVVLRGMAFIGDMVAHAVFPGVAIAFVLQANLVVGGTIAGLATATSVAVVSQNRRLKEDTVIGVFFAAAFALGIVVLSLAPGYSGSLESFLFGQILGISDSDVLTVAVAGVLLLLLAAALHRPLVTVALDRETAAAAGVPVFRLDLALYAMVTMAIVISLQSVGNVLVLALLVTPAACARLLTDRLGVMLVLAPLLGALASVLGLLVSFHAGLAAGGLIVLILTTVFLVCWIVAPQHGLVARMRARRRPAPAAEAAEVV